MRSSLKEMTVQIFLKKANVLKDNLNDYHPVANIPFMGKPIKRMVAEKLQMGDINNIDPFQLEFRPFHGAEIVLVTPIDDLLQEADQGNVNLLVLKDLSAVFDIVNHRIFLDYISGLRIGGTALCFFLNDLCQRAQLFSLHGPTIWCPTGVNHLSIAI